LLIKIAKLKRAKELSNRALKQTTRSLAGALRKQRKKKWLAGRAVIVEPATERYGYHSSPFILQTISLTL
jgi:hypothetical protein